MPKKIDPAKQKAKRQKMIAIVGGVVLVALLAFQLPRTMKMLKGPSATSSASSTPTATTPGAAPLAPPTLEGGSAASMPGGSGSAVEVSSDGVRDASAPLPADAGQLVSFSRFKSKDPFKQQVRDCGDNGCGAPTTPAAASPKASPAGATTPTSSAPVAAPSPASSAPAPAPAAAAPVTTAVLSVNGVAESVSVGKTFPAADPVFVLIGLTRKAAKITIAGGSLESGAASVTLAKGKTVTLQNTADGTRYVLKLVSVT